MTLNFWIRLGLSLSDLQSVRLVSSNDPQLVALKRDIGQAILALERSPRPTVKMTVEMRGRAIEMRKQADEMRKRAAEYRPYAEKHLRSSEYGQIGFACKRLLATIFMGI